MIRGILLRDEVNSEPVDQLVLEWGGTGNGHSLRLSQTTSMGSIPITRSTFLPHQSTE